MKNTKRALFLSVVSMFLCVVMLAGTTFAWFTDSVESTGNIIASGTLKVEMTYSDALNGTYADASTGKIFNYNLWEPGYTDVKYVKIENVGNLAFKYMLSIVPEGEASILANVIDVYFATTEGSFTAPTRSSMGSLVKVGTLADMIAEADGAAHGELSAAAGNNSVTACIALKMQESAGNEYQNLTIGNTGFSVKLVATQLTYENDSFDDQYDAGADYDGEISSYESLVAALANGGTYKVVKDIATENTVTVPAGKTVTLDLGGKTISSTVTAIENNGTLTVANGTIDVSASTSQATRVIKNNGTLILEGGSYKGTTALYSYSIWNAGTLTANGANVVGGFGGLSVNTGAKAEVNGGTYTVSSNAGGHTIYLQ
ncbi:MAG: hypothetical protein IJD67_06425, partial [Clostridia bacterium]|nr:hypothetical protein [Clostridia bacterium]